MEEKELGFPIISTDNIRFSDWCFASLKYDGKWYVRKVSSGEDPASLEFSSGRLVISQNDFRVGDVGYLKILENSIFNGKNSVVLVKEKKEPKQEYRSSSDINQGKSDVSCDHTIGIVLYECMVNMSEIKEWAYNIREEWFDEELEPTDKQFYFCPKKGCGAPIDWDSIKESLKQSNEKE